MDRGAGWATIHEGRAGSRDPDSVCPRVGGSAASHEGSFPGNNHPGGGSLKLGNASRPGPWGLSHRGLSPLPLKDAR